MCRNNAQKHFRYCQDLVKIVRKPSLKIAFMGSELKDRTSYDFTGLHPELYPQPELVREHMVGVTLEAGIAVSEAISQFIPVPDGENLSKRNKDIRVELLDTLAAARFEDYLKNVPFRVLSVASEGEKEWEKMGRGMPTVLGEHGMGEQIISIANDVVEGTTAASHNRQGAISVLASSTYGGIMPTPQRVLSIWKNSLHHLKQKAM